MLTRKEARERDCSRLSTQQDSAVEFTLPSWLGLTGACCVTEHFSERSQPLRQIFVKLLLFFRASWGKVFAKVKGALVSWWFSHRCRWWNRTMYKYRCYFLIVIYEYNVKNKTKKPTNKKNALYYTTALLNFQIRFLRGSRLIFSII